MEDKAVESITLKRSEMKDEGTKAAQVTGGSIFEILAARMALKCPCDDDASATIGRKAQLKGKSPCVENPDSASTPSPPDTGRNNQLKRNRPCEDLVENSSSASGQVKEKHLYPSYKSKAIVLYGSSKSEVIRLGDCPYTPPPSYPSEYAFVQYPDANVYGPGIPYDLYMEGGDVVAKISSRAYARKPRYSPNFEGKMLQRISQNTIKGEKPVLPPDLEAHLAHKWKYK